MHMHGSSPRRRHSPPVRYLLAAGALLLAIGFGPAVGSAHATETTVLSQSWETGLKSETPAPTETDPLTGQPDQWLVFSGGSSARPGSKEPALTGTPAAGTPPLIENPYGAVDTSADEHNFWHVQASPQGVCLMNPAIFPTLVTLGEVDEGCFLPPVSPPNNLSFAQVSSAESTGFCGSDFASNSQNIAKSGCNTKEEKIQVGSVISPPFKFEAAGPAILSMKSWFDVQSVESANFDVMQVEYSTNAGTVADRFIWHPLGALNPISNPGGTGDQDSTNDGVLTPPSWANVEAELPAAVTAAPEIRLRFAFDTFDNRFNGFRGWNIDDLSVKTPFNAPDPAITSVTTCVGNSVSPVTSIHGTDFLLGSSVAVDGKPAEARSPSSTLLQIPIISPGTHTLEVVDPNTAVKSTPFTFNQPSTCEPPPKEAPKEPPVVTTTSPPPKQPPPTPAPTPTPTPVPATKPPFAKLIIIYEKSGEIETEYDFPVGGLAEEGAEVLQGASIASVHAGLLSPLGGDLATVAAKRKKCKQGYVRKGTRCVSNKPVTYGRTRMTVPKAGHYNLRIKPSKRIMTALKSGKRLKVQLTLVFTPAGTTHHIRVVHNVAVQMKHRPKKK
jgi:hypothetical protein